MKQLIRWIFPSLVLFSMHSGAAVAEEGKFSFGIHSASKELPRIEFSDAAGNQFMLEDFKGKYVLLNIWATWCPPCRKELPDLQGLQQELGGDQFQVIALSTDAGRLTNVQRLYQQLGLDERAIFIDESGTAMRKLGVFAMPTTLLIGPDGRELGRKPGPADWDSTSALAFFTVQMADQD
uniref:TlpA family protein disulfide reductase n=1 Tax=Pararhizobium sp. IMCC3301 TaxID=3067904 RepID=UPI00274197E3|nr:TlpA disulfide reductase family protein [Pararhizobium sp. IMCC3301]